MIKKQSRTQALNQDSIQAFIHGIDTDVKSVTTTRLGIFAKQAEVTDMATFKAACKGAAKYAEGQGDKSTVQRITEVRQLYGAIRFCHVDVKSLAYHEAVKASREALNTMGIKFDGSKKLTDDESEAAKLGRLQQKAAREVNKVYDFTKPDAIANLADAIADKIAELEQEALEDSHNKAMDKIHAHASSIIAKSGIEYARALSNVLLAACVKHDNETTTGLVAIAA